jgi:phosphoglycerate dehydrogenase-like enzyme
MDKRMTNVLVLETHAPAYRDALLREFHDLKIQVTSSPDDAAVDFAKVDVLIAFGMGITDALFTRMPELKWVQSLATGVDHFLRSKTLPAGVILTSGRGIHGPAMRETVLHLMLSVSHDSNRLVADKNASRWERRPWPLLAGKTAAVIGTGVAGSAIGTALQALGMHVVGVSATPRAVDGFDEVLPREQLVRAAAEADYLVNVLPADAPNLKLFGPEIFAAMKPRAFFINVGRGETVDETALIEALQTRRIAGAGLDVFATEPLPATSPLWKMPHVFMAPHVGGLFEEYAQMAMPLIVRNMRAFLSGQTDQMTNQIERSRPVTAETQP